MQQKLSYVDNKLRIMGDILESLDLKKTTDSSEIYIFICLLVSEEMIFFNFFESTFIDAFININNKADNSSKEQIHKIIHIMTKICKLSSLLWGHDRDHENR